MASKTITVNVKADVEAKFRKIAAATHGKKKGYLGKALTEAMERWTKEKEEKERMIWNEKTKTQEELWKAR